MWFISCMYCYIYSFVCIVALSFVFLLNYYRIIIKLVSNHKQSIVTYLQNHLKQYLLLLPSLQTYVQITSLKKLSNLDFLADISKHPLYVCNLFIIWLLFNNKIIEN